MQIKTNNLTHIFNHKHFNEFKALNDVNTIINEGEFISIIGQSGSGKTTFIEHLNALLLPTFGEVIIDNQKIINTKRKIKNIKQKRKKVGVVFQFAEYQLFEETVEKDIIFGPVSMGMNKNDAKKKAREYIKLVGLDVDVLNQSPFSLSGGQKRRVALAGILAMEPNIIIFDEPTVGLDPHGEKLMYKIFQKLHKKGKGIIVVTHNLDHALEYTKRTLLFKNGNLIRDDHTLKILYDKKLLNNNHLELPRIVSFIHKLNATNKFKINNKIRTINELVKRINNE